MKGSKQSKSILKEQENITYLTSLPYQVIHIENFQATSNPSNTPVVINSVLVDSALLENFSPTVSINSMVLSDLLNSCSTAPDNMTASARIDQVVLKDLLNAASTNAELFTTAARIDEAVIKELLISNTAPSELFTVGAGIDEATISEVLTRTETPIENVYATVQINQVIIG